MTKTEQIDEIIKLTREASVDKNKKRLERRLKQVRVGLIKCSQKDIDKMYNDILEQGAKEYFNEITKKYK